MQGMKLNTFKNYRVCPQCENRLPLTRDYFKRLITQGKEAFHTICKSCEDKNRREKEWKEGKLLCHCCGEYKDMTEFSPNGGANPIRNNRRSMCKTCTTDRQRKQHRALDKESMLHKCLNSRFLAARDRAKRHNIPFNITLEYLENLWKEQQGLCALSGIPMTFELKIGRTHTNLSIDKIDREKGYILGNVQLVCMACNQIKSDLSDEEVYYFCKSIVNQYENKNKESTTTL